ncbi:MAG: hypothetical protein WD894_04635 [Pirellulales bacterium]
MDLILGVLAGNLIGVLPLVVLLLLGVGGYLITKRGGSAVSDSPWFWAFAFSAVGLLGVWAISGKYDDRQKRLEARYEARERIAEQRRGGAATVSTEQPDAATANRDYADDDSPGLSIGYSHDRQVPLHFLAAALLLASLASAVMLWRNERASTRARTTGDSRRAG